MNQNTPLRARIYRLLIEGVPACKIATILRIKEGKVSYHVMRLLAEKAIIRDQTVAHAGVHSYSYTKGVGSDHYDRLAADLPSSNSEWGVVGGAGDDKLLCNQQPRETTRINNIQIGFRILGTPPQDHPRKLPWEKSWQPNGMACRTASLSFSGIGWVSVTEYAGAKKSTMVIRFQEIFLPAENLTSKEQYIMQCGQDVANEVCKKYGYRLGLITTVSELEYAFRDPILDKMPLKLPLVDAGHEWWIDNSPAKSKAEWETRSKELAEIRGNTPSEIRALKGRAAAMESSLSKTDAKLDAILETQKEMVSLQAQTLSLQEKMKQSMEKMSESLSILVPSKKPEETPSPPPQPPKEGMYQ